MNKVTLESADLSHPTVANSVKYVKILLQITVTGYQIYNNPLIILQAKEIPNLRYPKEDFDLTRK